MSDLDIPYLELPLSQLMTENTKNPLILITCLSESTEPDFWQNWKRARPQSWLLGLVPKASEEQALSWLEAGWLDDVMVEPEFSLSGFKKALLLGSRSVSSRESAQLVPPESGDSPSALIQEAYHRIKNNLQLISSMLSLQVRRSQDLPSLRVLRETQNRVLTMALAHEKLYQSQQLEKLNLAEYARDLSQHLFYNYGLGLSPIQIKYDCDPLLLGVDAAISCGLIFNELISNAIKYAFPATFDCLNCEIWIRIRTLETDLFEIGVADNGVGLPPQVEPLNPDSLGLRLVNSLSRQLGAQIVVEQQAGTAIRILVPYEGGA